MKNFEDIKADLRSCLGRDHSSTYEKLVDVLASRKASNLFMLTYQSFAKELDVPPADPLLQATVNFFATSSYPKFHLLDRHFLVLGKDPEDEPVEIDDEAVKSAFETGVLEHPEGFTVEDFENCLLPYFVASDELKMLKGQECRN